MSFTPTGRPGKTISNTYTYTIHTAVCFDHLIWRGQKLALFIPEVFQTIIWRFTTFLRIYPHLFRFHWSIVPQYGTMTQLGHVDFFPGSSELEDWGWNQPGCWQFEDVGSCSHSRSVQYSMVQYSTGYITAGHTSSSYPRYRGPATPSRYAVMCECNTGEGDHYILPLHYLLSSPAPTPR